ncbi:hypothetical protein [Nostoc flagelliforme]|uniref:hypothetical protein n=1 Tax=Nostoc flagelliforme TaxID=1306274 RepID=UPI000C2D1009|nr:hypothetical protein [Nostoc flagelliforme]
MKSKKSVSYCTDPVTLNSAYTAATTMGISVEEIVRRAIREFANSLEESQSKTCNEGRSRGATVEIYDEYTIQILQDVVKRTSLTQSTVIYRCLKKYLEYYKPQIRQRLELILNQLNEESEAIAA